MHYTCSFICPAVPFTLQNVLNFGLGRSSHLITCENDKLSNFMLSYWSFFNFACTKNVCPLQFQISVVSYPFHDFWPKLISQEICDPFPQSSRDSFIFPSPYLRTVFSPISSFEYILPFHNAFFPWCNISFHSV